MTEKLLRAAKTVVERWESGDLAGAVRTLSRAIADDPSPRRTYVALYDTEWGATVHPFVWCGQGEPDTDTVAAALQLEFEPDCGESIEILRVDDPDVDIPRISSADQKKGATTTGTVLKPTTA